MRPRFPLSHRACYQKKREATGEEPESRKEGGLPTAIIEPPDLIGPADVTNRRLAPQFLVGAIPQF